MSWFRIQGPSRISGRFTPAGNKNAALPILAGCLLTDETVELANVPDIRDVRTLVELIRELGAEVQWTGPNSVRIRAGAIASPRVPPEMAGRIGRASCRERVYCEV